MCRVYDTNHKTWIRGFDGTWDISLISALKMMNGYVTEVDIGFEADNAYIRPPFL